MEDAIKIINLTKKFKDKTAVNDLSLTIRSGELTSLLGVNGAGKTTTIRMLSCLSKPTSGDALIYGKSIAKDADEVKRLIGISPQETSVAPNLTVRENLELIAGIYGFEKSKIKDKTNEIIEMFEFDEVLNSKAKTLSGGWQRKLSIAMAIITEPRVLFLDEPTLGLDVIARRSLWKSVRELKGKMTIILTTHYLEEAESLSDQVAIMVKGRLKAKGTVQEIKDIANTDNFEEAFVKISEV